MNPTLTAPEVADLISRLEYPAYIRHGLGIPTLNPKSAARTMREAAAALRSLQAERDRQAYFEQPILSAPATPADKAAAELEPRAYEYGQSNGDGTFSVFIERGLPRNPVSDWPVTPLYGPEAAERIAALTAELAEEKRINKQISDELDMREQEECMLDDDFRKLNDRAETAEAREAELERRLLPLARVADAVFERYEAGDGIMKEANAAKRDDMPVWAYNGAEITYGDLRCARAALAQKEGEKP